jgi:hypothetical protein
MDGFPGFDTEDLNVEDNNTNQVYQQFDMMNENMAQNWNISSNPIDGNNTIQATSGGLDAFASYQVDEEEENRQRARRAEEEERRSKLMQKMNEEIRVKQELRDRARQYLEDWRE